METIDQTIDTSIPSQTMEDPPDQRSNTAVQVLTLTGIGGLLSACGGGDESAAKLMLTEVPKEVQTSPLPKSTPMHTKAVATGRVPTADELFAWAERILPALFGGSPITQSSGGLRFRAYGNGTYLGVNGTDVLGLGPFTQGQVLRLGSLADFPDAAIPITPLTDNEAAQFLQQAQFSSLPGEIAALKSLGRAAWLEREMSAPRSQTAVDWMVSKGYEAINANSRYYNEYSIGERALWNRLLLAPDQVRQRCALALSEFFCSSKDGIDGHPWLRNFGTADYWDQLCTHAFGSFRALLEVVTLHPLIGVNLNTKGNQKEDGLGRVPDENYAREVMQLFSIGLYQLNNDGSVKRDANGKKLETYTNVDVVQLARVFTGYDLDFRDLTSTLTPGDLGIRWPDRRMSTRPMFLEERKHSVLEKSFLGTTIPAGTPGAESLRLALDTLFNHPNVGPFLGRQMIQRLVTSNPSPAYVARVAAAFNDNGIGVRGDLKAMFRAVLLDDEARSAAAGPTFGRLREPMVRFVQWGRTFASETVRNSWKVEGMEDGQNRIGQCPLRAPSVFNFYRPGYVPPSTRTGAAGLTAPEFQIVNETTASSYVNCMEEFIRNGLVTSTSDDLYTTGAFVEPIFKRILADYSNEMSLVNDSAALVNHLNLVLCGGKLTDATRSAISRALAAVQWNAQELQWYPAVTTLAQKKVHLAVFMVMVSVDYLVQK